MDTNGGRIAVRWTPNDQITFDAFGLVQETEIGGTEAYMPVVSGTGVPIDVSGGLGFLPPGLVVEEALQGGVRRPAGYETVTGALGGYHLSLWRHPPIHNGLWHLRRHRQSL